MHTHKMTNTNNKVISLLLTTDNDEVITMSFCSNLN